MKVMESLAIITFLLIVILQSIIYPFSVQTTKILFVRSLNIAIKWPEMV